MRILIFLMIFLQWGCKIKEKKEVLPYYETNGGIIFKLNEDLFGSTNYKGKVYFFQDTNMFYSNIYTTLLYKINTKDATIFLSLRNIEKGTYSLNLNNGNIINLYLYNNYYSKNPNAPGETYDMPKGDAGIINITESNSSFIEGTFECSLINTSNQNKIFLKEGKFKLYKK